MNTNKKRKFTAFDAIIAIILIALLAYMGYSIMTRSVAMGTKSVNVEFEAQIALLDENVADLIKEGDTVNLMGRDAATVKEVTTTPGKKMVFNSLAGTYDFEDYPNKVDVNLIITATGSESDTEIKIGNTIIRTGSNVPIKGKGYVGNSVVFSVNTDKEEQ